MSDKFYVVRTQHPKTIPKTARRPLHHLALTAKFPLAGALEKESRQKKQTESSFCEPFIFMSFRFSDVAHILGENSRLHEPDNGLSPITEESLSSTAR